MAAFTPPNPLGYAPGDPVTSAQMNAINIAIPKCPNFVDGGATYNPADVINIGGDGFNFTATTAFASTSTTSFASGASVTNDGSWAVRNTGRLYLQTNGMIVVQSTGEISVQTGGRLDIETGGAMNWRDGSLSTAEDGSTVQFADGSVLSIAGTLNFTGSSEIYGSPDLQSGATLTIGTGAAIAASTGSTSIFATGSSVIFNGTTTLASGTNLQLSPARNWERHSLRLMLTSYVANYWTSGDPVVNSPGPSYPTAFVSNWDDNEDVATSSPAIKTISRTDLKYEEPHYHWIALDDLPVGGTISQVIVTATGFGTTPTTAAQFRVVRVDSSGTVENMSVATNRTGTFTSTIQTTVTVNANATISGAYKYALVVSHPSAASGEPGSSLWIRDVGAFGTMSSLPIG